MSKKAVKALCIAILLPLICYFIVRGLSDDAVHMPRHYFPERIIDTVIDGKRVTDTIWRQLENITLTNQLGEEVSLYDLRGRIVVANFFFTRCPTICPYLTRNMKSLQDALKVNAVTNPVDTSFVHFLSFSIDPERDSVEVLRKYAAKYGVNDDVWWMLTGPKKTIYDYLYNEIKLPAQDGLGVDSNFIHTDKFVLIDKKGIVRGYYDGLEKDELEQLARDIGLLQLEKDKSKPSRLFAQLKAIWPIYIAALAGLIVFLLITRKPRLQPH